MSKSTPDDLAVAFRSLARREREAIDASEGAADGELTGVLRSTIERAAALVGSATDTGAIADAIEARPAAEWDTATLDQLREMATEAGTALRRIAERGDMSS